MNIDQARDFLAREFPQNTSEVLKIGDGTALVKQVIDSQHLRPGGTVSGPAMMTVSDCAAYVALLGHYGEIALAVTTNLNINFLRKPHAEKNILAECRLLKTGKRLVVCEIYVYSEGVDQPVAHATATYSIPPVPNS